MTHDAVQPLKLNRLPLSAQARHYLLGLIESGAYRPGEKLPSEKELATQLQISRPTLREALQNLEQDGILVRKHGVGTFVALGYEHQLDSGLERLESILQLAAQREMQVQMDALEVDRQPASRELADKLQVPIGTPLTTVRRVLLVDGKPAAYMADAVLSSVLSPDDVDDTFEGSVLDLIRQKKDKIAQAVADIVAINADSALAAKLKVKPRKALLLLEETLFNDQGTAVGFSRNYFIPDCFRFHVVRR